MKKACELCEKMARIRCEADEASLCWDCDAKVHAANFLVARHSRNLLCHVCQSPTPWSASGAKVGPAFSFCQKCSDSRIRDGGDEEAPAVAEAAEEEEEERDEKEMENQVVPWSPPESSSTSKNSDGGGGGGGEAVDSRKRCRHEDNFSSNHPSYDNNGCSTTPSGNIQKTDPGRVGVCDPKRFCRKEAAGSVTETPEIHTFDLNSPPSDVDVDLSSHQQI